MRLVPLAQLKLRGRREQTWVADKAVSLTSAPALFFVYYLQERYHAPRLH